MNSNALLLKNIVSTRDQQTAEEWLEYGYSLAVSVQRKTKSRRRVNFPPEIWDLIKSYSVGGTVDYRKSRLYQSIPVTCYDKKSNLTNPSNGYKKNDRIVLHTDYEGYLVFRLEENVSHKKIENANLRGDPRIFCKVAVVGRLEPTAYIPSSVDNRAMKSYRVVPENEIDEDAIPVYRIGSYSKLNKNQTEVILEGRKNIDLDTRSPSNKLKVY